VTDPALWSKWVHICLEQAQVRRTEPAPRTESRAISRPLVEMRSAAASDIEVAIAGLDYCSHVGRHNIAPGDCRFVVCEVGVANGSPRAIHVNPLNATLVDENGSTYPSHAATYSCLAPLGPVDVAPGNYVKGSLVFLVSAASRPARMIYRTPILGVDVVLELGSAARP